MKKAKNDKINIFENAPIPKAVTALAVPTILSSLVMVLYNLADTWFVGFLGDPVQNASVALAAPVLLAFNAVNNLFGVGSSSMMGRALGEKDTDTAKKCSAFGFWAAFISGILFSVVFTLFRTPFLDILGAAADNAKAASDYLFWTVTLGAAPSILNVVLAYLVRTEGASMHASIGTMSGCGLNMILDPVFIIGLDMGAAGAGCATFISNCAACIYFFVLLYVKRKATYVCLKPSMAKPRREITANVCMVGIPAAIQNLLNVTGMTILNNFMSAYGTSAVAAMGIAYKVYLIPLQITFGASQGIMPLLSYNYGSKNYKRAKETVVFSGRISVIFMICFAAVLFIFSRQVMLAFIRNNDIVHYGSDFLKAMCPALPFMCLDFLGVAVYQSFGKGMLSFAAAVMRKVVFEIPFLVLLNIIFPMYGLAFAQTAAEFFMAGIALCIMYSIFKKLLSDI